MDATIKCTLDETVIRLANGCTIHLDHDHGKVQAWAPGAKRLYTSQRHEPDDIDVRDALEAGLHWRPLDA